MIFGFNLQDKFSVFIAAVVILIIAGLSLFFFLELNAGRADFLSEYFLDIVLISLAIGLALAIIFGRIGAVTITGPIMALLKGVRNIEEGKYGYKIEINRRDEIGDLVKGFNQMSDKLGEVDKLKANFLSVISHELYTPITPIKDAAGQLNASPDLSQIHKQLVGIIDRQTNKMQKLVDEVLDFSWLEIKEWKLAKEPVSLKLLGEEALAEMKEAAASKSINLKLKLGAVLPTVSLDRKRIQHVLKILLDNALKFTPEQGEVTLEINRVSGGAEFAVADNGIGISKDNLEKIFTSFYQVEEHMTRTKGGMGLGLAIAQRIVEAHNGYIWAESQGLGEGSRFVFLLPIV
jgi:signal transduction histidine kinase